MGKKRVVRKSGQSVDQGLRSRALARGGRRKLERAVLHIEATYNNTKLTLVDLEGKVISSASSGSLGFRGAKKGTTFAASKVGELMAEKAENMGVKEAEAVVRGVGSGRESSLRSFVSRGISLEKITDATPVPFNGPKPRKPRRV